MLPTKKLIRMNSEELENEIAKKEKSISAAKEEVKLLRLLLAGVQSKNGRQGEAEQPQPY